MKIADKLMNRFWLISLIVFVGFLFFMSCKRNQSPLDSELEEITNIEVAYQKWQGNKSSSYQIEQRFICFCISPAGRWIRVTVKDNEIEAALDLETSSVYSTEIFDKLYTIEEAFQQIRNFEERNPATLEIEYDPRYGYPKRINFDGSTGIADDEFTLEMRSFKK